MKNRLNGIWSSWFFLMRILLCFFLVWCGVWFFEFYYVRYLVWMVFLMRFFVVCCCEELWCWCGCLMGFFVLDIFWLSGSLVELLCCLNRGRICCCWGVIVLLCFLILFWSFLRSCCCCICVYIFSYVVNSLVLGLNILWFSKLWGYCMIWLLCVISVSGLL